MRKLIDRLRFWMLLPMLAVAGVVEATQDLDGYGWIALYGGAALFFLLVMVSVIDREGGRPMRDRSESTHGMDTHGHYH